MTSDILREPDSSLRSELGKYRFSILIPVRFGDLDAFGHVNNAKYLTYFEEARMAYWLNLFSIDFDNPKSLGIILASASVNFRSPAGIGETLKVLARVATFGNKSFQMEYRIEDGVNGKLVADGTTAIVCFDYDKNKSVPVPEDVKKKILAFEHKS